MILGILLIVGSIIVYFCSKDLSLLFGTLSTIVSIILGISSFIYTYVSGKESLQTLNEIKKQNDKLIERLNQELMKGNLGHKNIENIEKVLKDRMEKGIQ